MRRVLAIFLLFATYSGSFGQDFSFEQLLANSPQLREVMQNPKYQTQIIYTQINRDTQNQPHFVSYTYQLDSTLYFYPASTVKMPTAFLALQRLHELGIDPHTPMRIGANRFPQTAVWTDDTAQNKLPSVAHYIKKIFLASDNDAFNRLYEFLGQDYINTQLKQKGFTQSRIKHRLVGGYDGNENQFINPLWFYDDTGVIYSREGTQSQFPFQSLKHTQLVRGKGYWDDELEQTIFKPFDFSQKNAIGLQDLHDQLQVVMFPHAFAPCERFNLKEEDYQFLYEWMSKLPRESDFPDYNEPDNYVKFILYGDEDSEFQFPEYVRIFNKPGFAYGFLTDVAYVADQKHGVEFLLAVQLLVNDNDIFNDGEYEYDSIGIPFLGHLGKAIYQFELKRDKAYTPDLTNFFAPWN